MLITIPNMLTYLRIAIIPALVGTMFYLSGSLADWLSLALFAVAGITDFFDGYLARAMAQQSPLGRMLDPIADKLLVATALLMLVYNGTIAGVTLFAAVVILCREIIVSGLREFLAEADVGVPVTTLAKWKTTLQMVAIGFLLAGDAGEVVLPGTILIGEAGLWLAALLTLYTGYDYLKAGMRHVVNPETERRVAEKRARLATGSSAGPTQSAGGR
jgi:CDP-diacylglycerol--glycerol-3-phosphate 3-phosphatidyltransferase